MSFVSDAPLELDPFDPHRSVRAAGLLRDFNDAGVLVAADVHVASRLARIGGTDQQAVLLAAALAVRAPRMGHVYVDLVTVRDTAVADIDEEAVDVSALPWPDSESWIEQVGESPLVAVGDEDDGASLPLRLVGSALYLDRYWREERRVAADLLALGGTPVADVRDDVLSAGIARLFAEQPDDRQMLAAATAVLRRLTVVGGGPGTGKTTTVARIVALVLEQAAASGAVEPLIGLATPTAKAAARLEEAVYEEAGRLDVAESVRATLREAKALTLHRLLGWRPDSHSRFKHHRGNRLPHDLVVVDETSMVSLSMMARLVEAVRPEARLVLVGDPGQLTSIEAGAVLGDIVGPASRGLVLSAAARERLEAVTGVAIAGEPAPDASPVGDGVIMLERVHRFGAGIAAVAEAVRRGDPDATVAALRAAPDEVTWIEADAALADAATLAPIRDAAVAAGRALIEAARAGEAHTALEALAGFRVLCAHRRGDHGAADWVARIERWLAAEIPDLPIENDWYVGRPLLVTENDYGLRLYNGDTGVIVETPTGRARAAFERAGSIAEISPTRLGPSETVYAMTIHKSQGSQFDTAVVVLPDVTSPLLTRELLYTAVTRARERLVVVGTDERARCGAERPVARASGLELRLWYRTIGAERRGES